MKRNYTNSPENAGNDNSVGENGKKEIEKFRVVRKKSSIPILAVGITFILMSSVMPVTGLFSLAVNIIAASIVHGFVKKLFPEKKIEVPLLENRESKPIETTAYDPPETASEKKERGEPEYKDETDRLIMKIDRYNTNINLLNQAIKDEFISEELYGIEHTINKIKVQMKEYKSEGKSDSKALQLEQFFDYYMPTIIKILNSYRRIEKNNLTGENASQTKAKIIETLPVIGRAFEKELDNMFSDEMLDITTDIVVLESMLSKDGLIDGMKKKE